MKHFHSLFLVAFAMVTSTTGARASSVVFSTFQENALPCECSLSSGRPLGFDGVYGNRFTVGPETDFTLDEIELAVGIISGTVNSLDLFLYSDISDCDPDVKAGPDILLESFRAQGQMAPFAADVPPIVVSSVSHPVLMASQSYWLLVTTTSDQTSAGWYQNNASVTGLVGLSLDTSSLCCVRTDLEETFEILGTPRGGVTEPSTPEPSTLAMTGGGLLLTAATFLRRKKLLS